jgi:hypothetical protein
MGNHNLRAGKNMSFTSADGAPHPQSFWCLDRMSVEIGEQALRLHFVGFHDAAAYDAERQPVAGAVKDYLVTGQAFLSAVGMVTEGEQPISAEILRLAWQAALDAKDTPDPAHEGQTISFFEAAVDAQ